MTAEERLEEIAEEIVEINDWLWQHTLTIGYPEVDDKRVVLLQKRDALELERENILENR